MMGRFTVIRQTIVSLALAGAVSAVLPASLTGEVVGVADGDTVTVLDSSKREHRIRLGGIDAPEKRQAFGTRSHQSLSKMVFRRTVRIDYDKTDCYGRIVGKVMLGDLDTNLEQVKRGMAWHYKDYEREQSPSDRRLYSNAEVEARAAREGLWVDRDPVPPWEFRRRR